MIDGLIHFNMLYIYIYIHSLVLQGSTNPISSSVMFISSFAGGGGGGGEPFDQRGTSGTSEGSNFPGVPCHSCSISQEGHLQMWGGQRTRETSWVSVQFYAVLLFSPRWHCCTSFTKLLLIYLSKKEYLINSFSLCVVWLKRLRKFLYTKFWNHLKKNR